MPGVSSIGILKNHQRGVSMVMAIFVIVVLSLLAAAMLRTMSAGSDIVARDILSARAFLTAESGAQLRLSDLFEGGAACTSDCPVMAVQTYGGMANSSWLNCEATVQCCRIQPGTGEDHYRLISTGRCGPAADQAVRVVEVQAKAGL